MVCLVLKGPQLPHAQAFVEALTGKFPQIRSIVININPRSTNVILEMCIRDSCGYYK